ncbi:aldehyde dehydrogenase family protein [Alteromonas sp. a30]|uniref:aldehyde dehydrogenase family protein n=1 Tax=Alteromonas sp. a30 TaxID=2730917 RepID=UPI00227DF24B|nr:aldehyde dehydrogenase family protein [Alteromonas sp. a30]MCY7294723.1 aldehyde dehydrogenase family protein [Alteromonas sp. a30]
MQIEDIAPKVEHLRSYFETGKTRSADWRIAQLNQLKKLTLEQEDKIREALDKDLNKCELEAWSAEVGYTVSEIDHSLKRLSKWMQPRRVATPMVAQPGKSYIQPQPLGTVLIIGAWNYPYQLVMAPLIAAISAGNCAVLKPSELASHTSALIAELVPQYLDKDAFTVIEGAVEETTELLKQHFDHILYTGGEAVGRIVMRAAAEHLTPVTLELGGKSPCVVDKSANLDVTTSRIAWCKWMNAGQTCVAPDYVIIEKQFVEPFMTAMQEKINRFYGPDNGASSQDYAKIINHRHWQRIVNYLEGQNVVFGGQHDEQKQFIAPTLVLNPDLASPIMQEEIFGPLLPIITVDSIDEAIPIINRRAKPLAMYIFTKDMGLENRLLNETSAGSVCINDGMMFMANKDLPFGGVGASGMGSYSGQAGFDTFSHLKAVMKRSFMMDVDLRYPPYNDNKLKWLKRLG